ncbi:MAG: glycosyltransferase, partial [Gammaproteobacteria bacterium]|nr:glycosyltransferase [Gammaproteobacteria bacterium]
MPKKDKIYFFLPDLRIGGAQKVLISLISKMMELNYDIELILLYKDGALLEKLPDKLNIIILTNSNHISLINYSLAFYKLCYFLIDKKPMLILSSLTGTNIFLLCAKWISHSKTKVIIQETNTLINIKSTIKYHLAKLIYPLANGIIAKSYGIKKDLVEKFLIVPQKVKVLYNPVNQDEIILKSKEIITENFIHHKIKTIISIGRLIEQKDYPTLIRSFELINQQVDSQLIIIGDGKEKQELMTLIKSLKLENRVYLPGYKLNPYKYLRYADLFMLTSKWEGFPNVILEALALNKAIIATDCHSGPGEMKKHISNEIKLAPVGDYN